MIFSSLVFLYAFLPLILISYFIIKNRTYRNIVLLVFSLIFYSWGEPKNIVIMLAASLVAYICGLLINKFSTENKKGLKKFFFIVGIILLVLNLFIFKYFNFFCDNIQNIFSVKLNVTQIALPIGISFYTFQILSYVIDLYLGKISVQKNYFYLTLYVSFFPQLIAGPIVRYQTIENEILNRKESLQDIEIGLKRFIIGLSKKIIIANNTAQIAEIIYKGNPEVYGSALYWLAAVAYALQIYFDFSGYSDMAIGLGQIFGFHFLENFNYPYISLSITDFWRRWHISLSTWFRDYVYIPLGGNRVKKARWIFNILAVWALIGFWHGAKWNFILWGLYYGIILLIEKLFLGKYIERLPKIFQWLYSAVLILVGWVIFNLTDFSQMLNALKMMFTFVPTDFTAMLAANTSIVRGIIYIPLGVLFSFPVFQKLKIKQSSTMLIVQNIGYIALFVICIIFITASTYNPFIYFRF